MIAKKRLDGQIFRGADMNKGGAAFHTQNNQNHRETVENSDITHYDDRAYETEIYKK